MKHLVIFKQLEHVQTGVFKICKTKLYEQKSLLNTETEGMKGFVCQVLNNQSDV